MLRLIEVFNAIPFSFQVSSSAEFQAGQCGQLTLEGNSIVATVSNGLSPLGVIDDQKTRAFTATAWDEAVIVPVSSPAYNSNNQLVTPIDIKMELANPNILPSSFISIPVPVQLIPRNGIVVFPAGTPLNYDLTGTGIPNAIKTLVRYTFQIPNILGDDSTVGSNRVTMWMCRFLGATDCFESNQTYPLNANLFVSELGFFTTRQPYINSPSIGLVTAPPTALAPSMLEFLWL